MAYTKLFNSIITSTIWSEDDKTRIVWITMMALADKNGEVQGSIPGIARIAGVSVNDCRQAVNKFLSPDPDSRTKDDEGRRVEVIEGGWFLINHKKYRDMATDADRLEKAAIRQQRFRDRKSRNESNATVTPESHQNSQAEAEAEAEANTATQKKNTTIAETQPIGWSSAGGWAGITDNDRKEWQEAFPACDVTRQLAAMTQWLKSNPKKAVKSQWRKFVTSWLSRAQDRGGDIQSAKPSQPSQPAHREARNNNYNEDQDLV